MKQAMFYQKKVDEAKEIQDVRRIHGLRLVKMGFQLCLTCDKQFFSEDLCRQKMCDNCRRMKEEAHD